MTTAAARKLYEAQHEMQWEGRSLVVYNPNGLPLDELPVIYGFNNGGSPQWFSAVSVADDGTGLAGHICSAEAYMPHDPGLIEGAREDRQELYREHYPDGFRCEFVPRMGHEEEFAAHEGLSAALARGAAKHQETEEAGDSPDQTANG